MARFQFQLEAVLEQRRSVERTRQVAVAELERQRMDAEDRIRGLQRQIVVEKEDLRDALSTPRPGARAVGGVDLRHVRLQAGASLHLIGKAQHAVVQLAGLLKRLDGARLELVRATTRRKAVEVLKERRYEQWRDEQRRRENAALDELSVMRAPRQEMPL
jgi:flagellar export protein FliJ